MYCNFLVLNTEEEYREKFKSTYCSRKILTHSGIEVLFHEDMFDHAFFKNRNRRNRDKSLFCTERAKRIMWIEKVLMDDKLIIYKGWNNSKRRYEDSSRTTLVTPDGYVVVIKLTGTNKARFVTAFIPDNQDVIDKIKGSPVFFDPNL